MNMDNSPRIAIDIGGTFTDAVLQIGTQHHTIKILTTSSNPADGFMQAAEQLINQANLNPRSIVSITHGTTLATNALIERRGAKTALITTEGHRDSLEMGHENRFDQYNFNADRKPPLVPRKFRWPIKERANYRGEILKNLDDSSIKNLFPLVEAHNIESIAVGLLHSYANPKHEKRRGFTTSF